MAYIYDLSDQWAASGTTFTAIKMNVTDTASAAGSLLMDLQVGGASKFSVDKNSVIIANEGRFGAQVTAGVAFSVTSSGVLRLPVSGNIGFTPTGAAGSVADLLLARDAANTLAQRNGVYAEAFNLYNTYTDASNYERGFMRFVSNVLEIGAAAVGTGTARAISMQSGTGVLAVVNNVGTDANLNVSATANANTVVTFRHSANSNGLAGGTVSGFLGRISGHFGFFTGAGAVISRSSKLCPPVLPLVMARPPPVLTEIPLE